MERDEINEHVLKVQSDKLENKMEDVLESREEDKTEKKEERNVQLEAMESNGAYQCLDAVDTEMDMPVGALADTQIKLDILCVYTLHSTCKSIMYK